MQIDIILQESPSSNAFSCPALRPADPARDLVARDPPPQQHERHHRLGHHAPRQPRGGRPPYDPGHGPGHGPGYRAERPARASGGLDPVADPRLREGQPDLPRPQQQHHGAAVDDHHARPVP